MSFTTKVSFDENYLRKCTVQRKQNQKFLKFTFKVLKELNVSPSSVLELGAGDESIVVALQKYFNPKVIYLVDKNSNFLEKVSEYCSGLKTITKDFLELSSKDFDLSFDLVISSNTLHWLPHYPNNEETSHWLSVIKLIYEITSPGGFFFVHQGLKWTYFPLYDLARELFMQKFNKSFDLNRYVYYPSAEELQENLKSVGFKLVAQNVFFETSNSEYCERELYHSFSVGGLRAFLSEVESPEDQIKFTEEFLKYCERYKPPIFAHRGFFALRKPFDLSALKFKLYSPSNLNKNVIKSLRDFLLEVDQDFYPPLSSRSPLDQNFDSNRNKDVTHYLNGLLSSFNLLCYYDQELVGLLSFCPAYSTLNLRDKVIYVSTIAVKRRYRRGGIGKALLSTFLGELSNLLREKVINFNAFPLEKTFTLALETRTWSTNHASISLLKSFGFDEKKTIPNHRGSGVGTIYFVKELNVEV